ncbi:hypothetical protein CDCA_CDCA07G2165 [Cyanidium caldarium]|uniref:Protein root UVB sensitive/RUS domain-containing protein n=1 Tax=Cyanidium caldarium TaxID=2771 RepID=A0AAV9IVK1_CYACA|nr:hypothetical protein CDCA_CDCA07G2165 [Cyanidium caldarium]
MFLHPPVLKGWRSGTPHRSARCANALTSTAWQRLEEVNEQTGERRVFVRDAARIIWQSREAGNGVTRITLPSVKTGWSRLLQTLLLPSGYPATVSPDYDTFWRWNILRHTLLEAAEVLGTQSMLLALGVGSAHLPLAAAWKWVLKDGLGYFAKVALGARLAPRVDEDPKRFRLYGDMIMAMGTAFEILTLLFPSAFLLLASLGNLLRKAADVATGPAYRVFLYHFSVASNSGDVSSRSESQVVVGRLLGIAGGIGVSAVLSQDVPSAFVAYGLLSAGHVYSTYQSVCRLQLRTLNRARLEHIFRVYAQSDGQRVPSVAEANAHERQRLWLPPPQPSLQFVSSLAELMPPSDLATSDGAATTAMLARLDRYIHTKQVRYLLVRHPDGSARIAVKSGASTTDVIQALWQAMHDHEAQWPPPTVTALMEQLARAGWDTARVLWPGSDGRIALHEAPTT